MIDKFLTDFARKWGADPEWLITDDAEEYTSKLVMEILGDMDVENVPTIAYNPKENGISERLNLTLMNAIRTALKTARLDWT